MTPIDCNSSKEELYLTFIGYVGSKGGLYLKSVGCAGIREGMRLTLIGWVVSIRGLYMTPEVVGDTYWLCW